VTAVTSTGRLVGYKSIIMGSKMSPGNTNINELYAVLPPSVRQELEKHEHLRTVPQGTTLIEHGRLPDGLVILNSGTVQISVPCPRRSASLTTGQAGKVFGMRAAISGEPPDIDVTCIDPCRVTFLPRDVFLTLLETKPEIYFAVAKVLSADLRIADRILRNFPRRCLKAPRIPVSRSV
jgi:CRP/FNR family cyclic AMP-dependent transcriptional regulator